MTDLHQRDAMNESQTSATEDDADDIPPGMQAALKKIHDRLDHGDQRMTNQDEKMAGIAGALEQNTRATLQVLKIVEMGEALFRVFDKIGIGLRWLWLKLYWLVRVGGVVAAGAMAIKAAIDAMLAHGQPPLK